MKKNFPVGTTILFAVFVIIVVVVIILMGKITPKVPQELIGVLRPVSRPLQPFVFKDQTGEPYTQANLDGKWTFLFFGYTYCPDICPTTLTVLSSLMDDLGVQIDTAGDVQVILVSVDPQRDQPEQLAQYLSYFNQDFIGITAGQDETLALAEQFGAMFFREEGTDSENYLMAHTGSIFLVNPETEFVASFSPPHDHQTIATQFETIRGLN